MEEIRDFAENFLNDVQETAQSSHKTDEEQLAYEILRRIEDSGEVSEPEMCVSDRTRRDLTAYCYNEEAEDDEESSLDLFYLIKADDVLGQIANDIVQERFRELKRFYIEARGEMIQRAANVQATDEIYQIAQIIHNASRLGRINLLRLYIITDGVVDMSCVPEDEEVGDMRIEYNVWDMTRIYALNNIRTGRDRITIDFRNADCGGRMLPCIKVEDNNDNVDSYMAVICGEALANIYRMHRNTILNQNVRKFLQFRNKVNKGIRETLRTSPEMFFSYNNGISTTASSITLKQENGNKYIAGLTGWQIVNGGQTTASIAASIKDNAVDLSKVFVPVKVSVVRDSGNERSIVKTIAKTANSQSAVKDSDLSANNPFWENLERLSHEIAVPLVNSKYYFERYTGQYDDEMAQVLAERGREAATAFKREYPKSKLMKKTDVAKIELIWHQMPHVACLGAEKCFPKFVKLVKDEKTVVTSGYYRDLVAKTHLYNTICDMVRAAVRRGEVGGYIMQMASYVMASISYLSGGNLDLTYIWDNQTEQQGLNDIILGMIPRVWNYFAQGSGGVRDIRDYFKKEKSWTGLIAASLRNDVNAFPTTLINNDAARGNAQEVVEMAQAVNPNTWFRLAAWFDAQNERERRTIARRFGARGVRNNEALEAMNLLNDAKDRGFNAD